MIKVNTTDGRTATIDLADEDEAKRWLEQLRNPGFQAAISGLSVVYRGAMYSLARPAGFGRCSFLAELIGADPARKIKGGERLTCFADGVRLTVMVHRDQQAVRIGLARTGGLRFSPLLS